MRVARAALAMMCVLIMTACSVPGPGDAPDGVYDPYEATNRRTHEFNRKFDQSVLRGAGSGYADRVPVGVQDTVANFADNVSTPRTVVNQILQGRLGRATKNTLRFAVNSTLGFAGFADPATDLGLPPDESDFGETLHVWGVPEGAYLALPFLGPSTERDAVGEAVDLFLNPLDHVLPRRVKRVATGARIVDKIGDRGQFGGTVDSVLYDSTDPYAQLRLIYLQNRRFELGGASGADPTYIDPEALDTEGF